MYTSIIASQLIAIIALIVACFAITGHISYRNKVGITRHVDLNLEYNETTNRYEGEFTLEANEYLDYFYIVTGEHSGLHEIILEVTDGVTDGVSLGASLNTRQDQKEASTLLHKSNKSLQMNSILNVKDLKPSQPQDARKDKRVGMAKMTIERLDTNAKNSTKLLNRKERVKTRHVVKAMF